MCPCVIKTCAFQLQNIANFYRNSRHLVVFRWFYNFCSENDYVWKNLRLRKISTFFSTWDEMTYWWSSMDVYVDGWMVPIQITLFESRWWLLRTCWSEHGYFEIQEFPQGAKPWPNFWVKLDLGIRNSTVLFPGSGRLPFSVKMAPKFCPNFTFCHFLQLDLINSCCHCYRYQQLIWHGIMGIFHIPDISVLVHIII